MNEVGRMFRFSSSGSSLPWLWIVEYLSSFPQIDISLIRGLIEAAPLASSSLGKDTSEMVALRCLEELFGPTNGLTDVTPPDSRVAFDTSLSCKDVLQHILREVSVSDLKRAGPELLRWDVHPFIMHKRASLPKCALEKLKDSILDEITVLEGDENAPKSKRDDSDDENNDQEGNLIPQIYEDDNEVLQDGLLERNLPPYKRLRSDLIAVNSVGVVSCKQDATCPLQSFDQIQITLHHDEQMEDETGKSSKVTEMEGNNMRKDSQANNGDQDVQVALKTLGQSGAVGDVVLLDGKMENADMMVEKMYGDRPYQNAVMHLFNHVENGELQISHSDDASKNFNPDFPPSSPNSISADRLQQNIIAGEAKAVMERPSADEICEYENERFNIDLKKSLFLSSQCTPSQDSQQKSGLTEQNFCVKCNKKGQVLVCSANGCPLVVHESCLGFTARFDDKGKFVCPFCTYSASISKYLEAKGKASLARKELPAFMELCSKKLTEELWMHKSHLRLNADEDLVGIHESGPLGGREHNFICQTGVVNHETSASCLNGVKQCVQQETFMVGAVCVQGEKNEEEDKLDPGQLSMREHEHQQDELPANLNCSNNNLTSENTVTFPANQVEVGEIVKEVVQLEVRDPPQMPVCSVNSDGEESSTAANDKFIISSYPRRSKKHKPQYTFPPIPLLRRKKVPWTKKEEEMLRNGVMKFGNHGGAVPWKEILDFGGSVFLKGRTAIDLKDKWRNMCKASLRCK